MKVMVVVESWFGNTRVVAESIGAGLAAHGAQVELLSVDDAPSVVEGNIDLLVVGAPTHNRGLSTQKTRAKAAEASQQTAGVGAVDWLSSVTLPQSVRVAAFDTSTGRNWLSGSAAKAAARILSQRTRTTSIPTKTFVVRAVAGPLQSGETNEAQAWGKSLVTSA